MRLYTRKETAQIMKIGLRTLDRRLATGQLRCFRLGSGPKAPVRVAEEHIAEFLKSCSGQTSETVREQARNIIGP